MVQTIGYEILAPVAQMATASFGLSWKFGGSRLPWVETFSVSKTSTLSRTSVHEWKRMPLPVSSWYIYEQKYLCGTSVRLSVHLSVWLSFYPWMHASALLYSFVLVFAFDYQFGILLQTENSILKERMRGTYPFIHKSFFAFRQVYFFLKNVHDRLDMINPGCWIFSVISSSVPF